MIFYFLLITFFAPHIPFQTDNSPAIVGAWETTQQDGQKGIWIFTEDHFSVTYFKEDPPEFISTAGGKWNFNEQGEIELLWEFNTKDKARVGKEEVVPFSLSNNLLSIQDQEWKQIDSGSPGELQGAWVITGRQQNGEINSMTPGARKTMKILSGTRFQWIAYNSETGEFFGTGGGTYTTKDGKYTENIDFFSRDNSRVGAELVFNYELEDGKWHHSGKSSKGDPLYEIWSTRKSLGL